MKDYVVSKEKIAEICHNVNKTLCEFYGDHSHKNWDDTPCDIKKSVIDGVEYHLREEVTPKKSHENWLKFKINDGWVYGSEKNYEKKTHPSIVSYDKLPESEKLKDKIFKTIVDTFKYF
jgi:hypothetical protein